MSAEKNNGKVFLVGAGPGDPGLVTTRAHTLIKAADVLVYDYLANAKLLEWAQLKTEKIYVGKSAGRHSIPQDEIESILVDRARKGLSVVRLKGGDPFIFGRGGEEIAQLEKNGIPFEIVPGVTAALAAAAYTGIPLSHRDFSSAVTFLTGHENPEKETLQLDFRAYARTGGTLCIYMGVGQLPKIVEELREGGCPGTTPVGVIQWATLNHQRSLFTTLDDVAKAVENAGMGAPAMIFVGDAVAHRSKLSWFENRPLFGRRIVVTRAREQAGKLTDLLEAEGAEVLELPMIEVHPDADQQRVTEIFAGLATYEWLVFTSTNGVHAFFDLFTKAFSDIRCLGPMRIAAIGKATADAIRARHLKVDLVPETANGDALADALLAYETLDALQVLIITGNMNRPALANRLESEGRAIVDTLPLYRTEQSDLHEHSSAQYFREAGADAVLFTSSSTARHFLEQRDSALQLEEGARRPVYGSIGTQTSKTLRENGETPAFEADKSNLKHFVESTIAYFKKNA
ncbi:MAG: uroporphyrinogen-III C-methyltransferase [Opitutales bacterium]